MTPTFPPNTTAAVLTISDRCAQGQQQDLSGPAVTRLLETAGITHILAATLPDELDLIVAGLHHHAALARLVLTTGGTGLAPRDVTPEATQHVVTRLVDGLSERMRSAGLDQTPFAPLSRGISGTLGATLIINLPGSPNGAVASLFSILPLLPHALSILSGHTAHHHHTPSEPIPGPATEGSRP